MRLAVLSLVAWAGVMLGADLAQPSPGTVRISWEECDPPLQSKYFDGDGQGQIVTLVASVIGSDVPNNGHRIRIAIAMNVADAWRFDSDGCQFGRLDITHEAVNAECAAFQGGDPLGLSQYFYDPQTAVARLDIVNTYDAFTPDPTHRYTLWQAHFDHTYSTVASGNPPEACGYAGNPLVFATEYNELLETGGNKVFFEEELNCLFWNTDSFPWFPGGEWCFVQVQATTWGRVKSHYR